MVGQPKFGSFAELESSQWMRHIVEQFDNNTWPVECIRCQQMEAMGEKSVRQHFNDYDSRQTKEDYLVVGGVLDNICNSACQTCESSLSTKIGQLENKKSFLITNNTQSFYSIPQTRIVKLDISGGEPSASKNYKELLRNLPPNVKEIRINTNCSRIIPGLDVLLKRGIQVTITASLDGLHQVHEYLRWPISWSTFKNNLFNYMSMTGVKVNVWTTVSSLNINDFLNIVQFCQQHSINHSYSLLKTPKVLDVRYKNNLTLAAKEKFSEHTLCDEIAIDVNNNDELAQFIGRQDMLRGIQVADYIKEATL